MTLPDAVAALRTRRDALTERLAQGLAADAPLAELEELQARLKLYDAALLARPPAAKLRLRRHAIALVTVAALVSIAAWLPMPRVTFTLELQANSAQLQMPTKGSLDGGEIDGELRAEGFSALESADTTLIERGRDGRASQLGLRAEHLALRRIVFPGGTRLDLAAGPRSVHLSVDGAPHTAEFEFGGQVSSSFAGAPRETAAYPVAEWMKLVSASSPTELWLAHAPEQTFLWAGLQPASLRFIERQPGGDGEVRAVSSLRQATLRVPATKTELQLSAGSDLELDGLRLNQAEMSLGNGLALKLAGSAERLVVGTGGFSRSLKPSWLEYAAYNYTLGLVWSAAGLLWGMTTWLRKQFDESS